MNQKLATECKYIILTFMLMTLLSSCFMDEESQSDNNDSKICTKNSVAGIVITLTNSTGDPLSGATIIINNGSYQETLFEHETSQGQYSGAYERAGKYEIEISLNGYKSETMNATVEEGECHVYPRSLSIVLATNDEILAGPCVEEYLEPVLTIQNVSDSLSGEAIPRVELTSFLIDGKPINIEEWNYQPSTLSNPSFNTNIKDGILYCEVPCGFGIIEGQYDFIAYATNYQTKNITITAKYESFIGGCPSFRDNGTTVSLELEEQ